MTVFICDKSDFDTNEDLSGFVGATHKVTEGTTVTHQQYGRRLNLWRGQGYKVLGAYHVLRTPGSAGNGSLSSQLDFWLSHVDSLTPWWRDQPFMLQVDAEKWPYDPVSLERPLSHEEARRLLEPSHFADLLAARASTTMQFAQLLVANVPHGWKVTYASHGQYGDSLAGIATPLWNANYGPNDGVYPGDSSSRWDRYSDQDPVLLQFCSKPFDKNAFRGTADQLLALITGGTDVNLTDTFKTARGETKTVANFLGDGYDALMNGTGPYAARVVNALAAIQAGQAAESAAVSALAAQIKAGGGSVDVAAIQAAITAAVADVQKSVDDHFAALRKAAQAEADALQ